MQKPQHTSSFNLFAVGARSSLRKAMPIVCCTFTSRFPRAARIRYEAVIDRNYHSLHLPIAQLDWGNRDTARGSFSHDTAGGIQIEL